MLLALAATAIVALALLSDLILPRLEESWRRLRARRRRVPEIFYDPGRERRAEQRARQLLRSCVNEEEWAIYRDLGFVRVWGVSSSIRATAWANGFVTSYVTGVFSGT